MVRVARGGRAGDLAYHVTRPTPANDDLGLSMHDARTRVLFAISAFRASLGCRISLFRCFGATYREPWQVHSAGSYDTIMTGMHSPCFIRSSIWTTGMVRGALWSVGGFAEPSPLDRCVTQQCPEITIHRFSPQWPIKWHSSDVPVGR